MGKFLRKTAYRLRDLWSRIVIGLARKKFWRLLGMDIGSNVVIGRIEATWPHQVRIGNSCLLENNVTFKFDGVYQDGPKIILGKNIFIGAECEFNIRRSIEVGDHCLIASGSRFIDHDHGIMLGSLIRLQEGIEEKIIIGIDVWIGCNVVVLKGVKIGDGAIIGAGAVVTKSVGPREIWAGVPARKIGVRPNI